jgi:Holliday junction resolvasome RuvABC ATP-dependent DNA helicase subunit
MLRIEKQIDEAFEFLPDGIALCLTGPSGTGKTYNAHRLAKKFGMDLVLPTDKKTSSTASNIILFYEEAQRMKRQEQEDLLSQIDESAFYTFQKNHEGIPKAKKHHARFLFATTHLGDLIEAVRTRCVEVNFSYYSNADMKQVILNNFKFDDTLIQRIIFASKGTPRQAVKIGSYVKTYQNKYNDHDAFNNAIKTVGVNFHGFSRNDVIYMITLFKNGVTSEKNISNVLGLDPKTIRDTIENYLFREDYIEIISRGRRLSDKGYEYVRKNLM